MIPSSAVCGVTLVTGTPEIAAADVSPRRSTGDQPGQVRQESTRNPGQRAWKMFIKKYNYCSSEINNLSGRAPASGIFIPRARSTKCSCKSSQLEVQVWGIGKDCYQVLFRIWIMLCPQNSWNDTWEMQSLWLRDKSWFSFLRACVCMNMKGIVRWNSLPIPLVLLKMWLMHRDVQSSEYL